MCRHSERNSQGTSIYVCDATEYFTWPLETDTMESTEKGLNVCQTVLYYMLQCIVTSLVEACVNPSMNAQCELYEKKIDSRTRSETERTKRDGKMLSHTHKNRKIFVTDNVWPIRRTRVRGMHLVQESSEFNLTHFLHSARCNCFSNKKKKERKRHSTFMT